MYYILIIEGKYKIANTAKGMRISDDTLYRYCRAEKIPPPGRVIDLINVTGDIRFLRFYCDPCGYMPVAKVKVEGCVGSLEKKEIKLSILLGKAVEKIEKSKEDGVITKKESNDIHQALLRLRELEAEMDECIKQEVR